VCRKEQGHSAQLQAVQGTQQQAAASSSLNSVQASQLSAIVAENQDLVQRLAAMHGRMKGLRAQLSSKEAEVDQKEAKVPDLPSADPIGAAHLLTHL
jgi:endo-1,4-beta-D-glucanase Y